MAADDSPRVPDDPRAPLLTAELAKYIVVVVPMIGGAGTRDERASLDVSAPGSGTCVLIGGRYFIATAAHVIVDRPPERHFIVTATPTDRGLPIVGGGHRSSPTHDVGWLELDPTAAKHAERTFLDLARMRSHCNGVGEAVVVCGAPVSKQTRDDEPGSLPLITSNAEWFPVKALSDAFSLGGVEPHADHLYLEWPRRRRDGSENPEPYGISGGGVWATNLEASPWRANGAQLIGIENAVVRTRVPERYLKACQIQVWLAMVAEDVPALAPEIAPIISAGRHWSKH